MSKKFKFWLNIITIVALFALAYGARHQVVEAFRQLVHLNAYALLMIIPLQILSYYAVAKTFQSYFNNSEPISLATYFRLSLEMNFVSHVFPSGGVSGFSYLALRLKQKGVTSSRSTLAQGVRYALMFFGFTIYLAIAMILLASFGKASRFAILIATTIVVSIIFLSIVVTYVISDERRIKGFTAFLPKLINRFLRPFRKHKGDTINIARIERLFGEMHQDYVAISQNWRQLVGPFLWTLVMLFAEMATIYVVYIAFGELINPGALILAYAVANVAGLISLMPGGVGVYEALMTSVLASVGVDSGLAFSATLVYRILNMILFVPPGYILYQRALRHKSS